MAFTIISVGSVMAYLGRFRKWCAIHSCGDVRADSASGYRVYLRRAAQRCCPQSISVPGQGMQTDYVRTPTSYIPEIMDVSTPTVTAC